jgi:hypothetical protein
MVNNERNERKLLPIQDAAKVCGVCRKTLHNWIRNGRLKIRGHGMVRNFQTSLVDVAEAAALVENVPRGRPKQG